MKRVPITQDTVAAAAQGIVDAYFVMHGKYSGTRKQNAWIDQYIHQHWPEYDLKADPASINDALAVSFENRQEGYHF